MIRFFTLSCRTNFWKLPVFFEFRCLATKKLEEREIEITISYFYYLLICIGFKELSLSKSIFVVIGCRKPFLYEPKS